MSCDADGSIKTLRKAYHTKDARVAKMGISSHILRTLEYWSWEKPNFETEYVSLSFGSRILFENLAVDIRNIGIRIVLMHYLERQLLSCEVLEKLWGDSIGPWPEFIDIRHVRHCRQLQGSVSVVQVSGRQGSHSKVMKALMSHPKYLYHELKLLLTLLAHLNIISWP